MRVIKGLAAFIAIVGIIAGIPLALWAATGNPLENIAELEPLLRRADYGGTIFFGTIVPLLAWLGWLWLAAGFALEIVSAITRVRIPRIPALSPARGLGSVLIGAIMTMGATAGLAAPAQAAQAVTPEVAHAAGTVTNQASVGERASSSVAAYPRVTVAAGQTLWGLAEEYLGDGMAFKEIAELNYGVSQADGMALDRTHVIQPGWVLKLPAKASVQVPKIYTVKAGDTLSSIADRYLGDAGLYEQIAALNPSISDPDAINVGQKIRLPQVKPSAGVRTELREVKTPGALRSAPESQARAEVESAPVLPVQVTSPATSAPVVPSASESPAESALVPSEGASAEAFEVNDEVFPVRTVGGIGAVLAAGLLGLLGKRRWSQRRHRQAGSAPVVVGERAQQVETRLREVQEPVTVDQIDDALRFLAAWSQQHHADLPDLFCVRSARDSSTFTLYLAAPADLPVPFSAVTDDLTVWQVDPRDLPDSHEQRPSAPYPGLTTIGHDADEATLLLDLEHVGALGVSGDPLRGAEVLNALAVELGVSPWGECLQVSLVGFMDELPGALGTDRVQHFDDLGVLISRLEARMRATAGDLAVAGVSDVREARVQGLGAEAWTPEIVLIAGDQDPVLVQRMRDLASEVPRLGVCAVVAGESDLPWRLELGEEVVLAPIGMELTPQTLSDEEAGALVELLEASTLGRLNTEPEGIPEELAPQARLQALPVHDESDEAAVVEAGADELSGIADSVTSDEGGDDQARSVVDEHYETGEQSAGEGSEELEVESVELSEADETISPLASGDDGAPFLQVLGTVGLLGARGTAPISAATKKVSEPTLARCQALIAYISLNPGATSEQVHEAFWPNANSTGATAASSRNKLTNQARKYLGEDDEGVSYLPHAAAGYRLDPRVRSDWDFFQELVGTNPATASTTRLVAALRLVRGAPFEGTKDKNYGWNETVREAMIDRICDSAHVLMKRALEAQDQTLASLAARVGRTVDPANEQMWRNEMLAEHLAGNVPGIEAAFQRLVAYLDSFGEDYEPEAETQALHERLTHEHRVAS